MLILVGLDDSPSATQALRWSHQVATAANGSVCAVRSWAYGRLSALHGSEPLPDATEMDDQVLEEVEQRVNTVLGNGSGVEAMVARGPAKHAFPQAVRDCDADIAMLGRRRLGPLDSVLLGSVGRRLVDTATCPVVLMTEDTDLPEVRSPLIMVGIDGSDDSWNAMQWAAELTKVLGGELVVVHINSTSGPESSADPGDGARHPLLQEAAGRLEPFGVRSRLVLSWGDPRSALDRVAEQNAADLLVVASRGRGALPKLVVGSVAAYLLRHADRAVAVVPHGTQ